MTKINDFVKNFTDAHPDAFPKVEGLDYPWRPCGQCGYKPTSQQDRDRHDPVCPSPTSLQDDDSEVEDLNSEEISGRDKVEITNCVFCISGYCPWYAHVANGVCFRCNGTGKERTDWRGYKGDTHSFQADDQIWQFCGLHSDEDQRYTTSNKDEVTHVYILVSTIRDELKKEMGWPKAKSRALKANALNRLLFAMISPPKAREIWDGVRAGELHLQDLTDELLEVKGQRGGYTNWL